MSDEGHDVLDGAISPSRNPNLFGHQAAEDFLARSYHSGKGHHAILIEGPEGIGTELMLLRLGLLHAQKVGILPGKPVEEALAGRRPQAVGIEADDAHVRVPLARCRTG